MGNNAPQPTFEGTYLNQIITGDALAVLKTLPDAFVQCCITSPPYLGLRSYLPEGHPDKHLEIGLEETPEQYISKLVEVFREVKRVLRHDGICWVNIGDTYAGGGRGAGGKQAYTENNMGVPTAIPTGYKPKDLMLIPYRLALALQADGWWIRSDCIWHKLNCLPESMNDRPTKAHEYVYLLSKSANYYYDAEAIAEPAANAGKIVTLGPKSFSKGQAAGARVNPSGNGKEDTYTVIPNRNKRTVWNISTVAYPESHFAVMPSKLVEICLLAGTSPQACEHCSAPWERVTERIQFGKVSSETKFDKTMQGGPLSGSRQAYRAMGLEGPPPPITIGWQPTCSCSNNTGEGKCIILDPFIGAGTVALVALQHHRYYLGIELNPEYVELAKKRIETIQPVLWEVPA